MSPNNDRVFTVLAVLLIVLAVLFVLWSIFLKSKPAPPLEDVTGRQMFFHELVKEG